MSKTILLAMLLATSAFAQQKQSILSEPLIDQIRRWNTMLSGIKPEEMPVSYQGGKVIQELKDICSKQLSQAGEQLRLSNSVYARLRVTRHLGLATQCVDELGLNLSNSGVVGDNTAPPIVHAIEKANSLLGEMMTALLKSANQVDNDVQELELAAQGCSKIKSKAQ